MIRPIYIPVVIAVTLFASHAFAQEPSQGPTHTERIASVQGQNTSLNKQEEPKTPPRRTARTHLVVNGDTLWELSSQYLNDPMMWPALWSYNPQVTNPHWIYPGDTIYLEPKSEEETVSIVPVSPALVEKKAPAKTSFRVPGFYLTELPQSRGHILFSDQEKNMLAPLDEVQIDFVDIETRKKVHNGQKFTIFSESNPVRNEDGDPMAYKLIRLGSLQIIDHQTETLSTAKILEASREISRGDLIIPDEDLVFTVDRTKNSKSMEGRIIDTIDLITQISSEQYVIINRGSEDGIAKGNRWVIFEQREGLNRLPEAEEDSHTQYADDENKKSKDDENKDPRDGKIERDDEHSWVLGRPTQAPEFPKRETLDDIYGDREYTTSDLPLRKIGEVLVVDTRDKFCTGIVMNSSREVGIDTRVVMIKGQ